MRALAIACLSTLLIAGAQAFGQTLSISSVTVGDFAPVTLDGSPKTTNATMQSFTVTDSRLVAAGWNVTVQATRFQQHNGTSYVSAGKTLPTGSLTMPAPSVTPVGTVSPPPIITPGPYVIDGATVKIATALVSTGLGRYDFTHPSPLILAIPASAFAVRYRSEVSVSVVSGP